VSAEEDLDKYEAEAELKLYEEYKAVLPMFKYAVETDRRFYLANKVALSTKSENGSCWSELELEDGWVWDMYRPARFVQHVKVVTNRDVNIETLPENEL
jgi:hypothetical protein